MSEIAVDCCEMLENDAPLVVLLFLPSLCSASATSDVATVLGRLNPSKTEVGPEKEEKAIIIVECDRWVLTYNFYSAPGGFVINY